VKYQIILVFTDSSALLQHSYLQTRPHTDPLHICPGAQIPYCSILPYITQQITTYTVNGHNTHFLEVVDVGHRKLYNNMTGHRTLGEVIGFCTKETVKMTSMMHNNPLKSWQLHRRSKNSLCLWILNVHYHYDKHFSLILKSNQVKIQLNIIIPTMLTSLN
jgi:hypothetical protein